MPARRGRQRDLLALRFGMKQVIASLCVCWAAFCGTQSNIVPLNFGMTPEEVSSALGVPLVYYSGRAGSEIYLAYGSPGIPGFYPVDYGDCAAVPQRPADRLEEGLAPAAPVPVLRRARPARPWFRFPSSIFRRSSAGSSGAVALRNSLDLARLADRSASPATGWPSITTCPRSQARRPTS